MDSKSRLPLFIILLLRLTLLVKLDKQGISKRFLGSFQNLDKSVGERALGPDQTILGKLQSTVGKAVQHAKSANEENLEKGYLKTVQPEDVSFFFQVIAMKWNGVNLLFPQLSESYLVSFGPDSESSGVLRMQTTWWLGEGWEIVC